MLEKGMQKVWKMMQKWSQNGCQNRQKMQTNPEKGMPKIMLKFDAEKRSILDWILIFSRASGGRGGMLSLQCWQSPGLFYLQRLTPAGVGGFGDPQKIGNRSKTELSRIDGRLGLLKMASGRGFGKNMEI